MNTKRIAGLLVALSLLVTLNGLAEAVKLTVQADQLGAKINPAMWGIFFEDINLGADGGLYAELVKNRSFDFPDPMMGWAKEATGTAKGSLAFQTDSPFNPANARYLRVQAEGGGFGP